MRRGPSSSLMPSTMISNGARTLLRVAAEHRAAADQRLAVIRRQREAFSAGLTAYESHRSIRSMWQSHPFGETKAWRPVAAQEALRRYKLPNLARQASSVSSYGRIPTVADSGRISVDIRMRSGELISSSVRRPPLETLDLLPRWRISEQTRRAFEALDRIEEAWADDALWFLLSRLRITDALLFDALSERGQVEAATLDALERVFQDGTFIETLCKAIERAPYMEDYHRDILRHALGHVERSEYRLAISHLMDGLEGSITRAAIELSVIGSDRWLIGEPRSKKTRPQSVDTLIKKLALDDEFRRFLHRGVFGKRGNPVRHGAMPDDERRRALLIVVAIVGWMDVCLRLTASTTLADVMSIFLPEAVSRQRQLLA